MHAHKTTSPFDLSRTDSSESGRTTVHRLSSARAYLLQDCGNCLQPRGGRGGAVISTNVLREVHTVFAANLFRSSHGHGSVSVRVTRDKGFRVGNSKRWIVEEELAPFL